MAELNRGRGWNARGKSGAQAYGNPEIMQAVLDHPEESTEEISERTGYGMTTIREARHVLRELPELVPQILDGSMSLHKAMEIIRHGDRIPCPVCSSKGYVFRKRK